MKNERTQLLKEVLMWLTVSVEPGFGWPTKPLVPDYTDSTGTNSGL